jgi:spore coat protein U-like protein
MARVAGASVSRRFSEPVETMMKTLTKAALAATLATALFASPAFAAAAAATAPFTAKATIVKPLTLKNLTDLDFGTTTMNPTLTSATVSVSSAGGAAVCSNPTMLTCSGGKRADFTLTGVAGQTVTISLPAPTGVLTHTNGTNTVSYSLDPVSNVTLDTTTGAGAFAIGGKITIAGTTLDGDYAADIDVDANYL